MEQGLDNLLLGMVDLLVPVCWALYCTDIARADNQGVCSDRSDRSNHLHLFLVLRIRGSALSLEQSAGVSPGGGCR